jgi:hypothetical protein
MGRTACTEPQCLYKGDLYLFYYEQRIHKAKYIEGAVAQLVEALRYKPEGRAFDS